MNAELTSWLQTCCVIFFLGLLPYLWRRWVVPSATNGPVKIEITITVKENTSNTQTRNSEAGEHVGESGEDEVAAYVTTGTTC